MSGQANLEIVAAYSFTWGDITAIVRSTYLSFVLANPANTSNTWSTSLPAIRGAGLIAWRVRYPEGQGFPETDFGTSSIQTTLCSFEEATATLISYNPAAYVSTPFVDNGPFFVSSLYNGSANVTPSPQAVQAAIANGVFTLAVPPPQVASSSNGLQGADPVFMVYGYIVPRPQLPSILLFGVYHGSAQSNVVLPATPPPLLRVLGACYGNIDVSDTVRSFIDSQQNLTLDLSKRDRQLITGSPGPANPTKTLSILYQYEGGDVKCWASNQSTGLLAITLASQPVSNVAICRRPRAGEPNVLALIWGDGTQTRPGESQPLAEAYNQKIFTSQKFVPNVAWFDSLDPNPGVLKSCHLYYSYGLSGNIQVQTAYEGGTISVRTQDTHFIDPQPARGLLRPEGPVPCFTLTCGSGRIMTVQPNSNTANGYQLVSAPVSSASPAHFMVVRANTQPDTPFGMLMVHIQSPNVWAYLGIPPGSNWASATASSATFLIPGQNGVPAAAKDFALAFNYEVPSRADLDGTILAASKYSGPQATPYYSGVQVMLEQANGTISLVPAQSGIDSLPQVIFKPQFAEDPNGMPPQSTTMIAFAVETDVLDSCLMQFLSVLKIFVWDLPVLLLDFKGFNTGAFKWHRAIADWWTRVSTKAKAAIMVTAKLVQAAIHQSIIAGQQMGISDSLHNFALMAVTLYDGDCLWSLFKSLSGGFSWWTLGRIILNLVGFAIELLNPETLAVKIVKYAILLPIWIIDSWKTISGWYWDCFRSMGTQAIALGRTMSALSSTAKVLALPVNQQWRIMHALTAPVLHQIITKPSGSAARVHPMISFKDALGSDAGLQQEHLDDPFAHLYQEIGPEGEFIVREMASEFQKHLE